MVAFAIPLWALLLRRPALGPDSRRCTCRIPRRGLRSRSCWQSGRSAPPGWRLPSCAGSRFGETRTYVHSPSPSRRRGGRVRSSSATTSSFRVWASLSRIHGRRRRTSKGAARRRATSRRAVSNAWVDVIHRCGRSSRPRQGNCSVQLHTELRQLSHTYSASSSRSMSTPRHADAISCPPRRKDSNLASTTHARLPPSSRLAWRQCATCMICATHF